MAREIYLPAEQIPRPGYMVASCGWYILHFQGIPDTGMLEPSKSSSLSSLRTLAIGLSVYYACKYPLALTR